MRITKELKGTKYVPYPIIDYPQALGFRIEPHIQAFSRALGIQTGHATYYQGARGSFKMMRVDLVKILKSDPMRVFTFEDDADLRKYYRKHFGPDMDEFYAQHDPEIVEHKKGTITLKQYPAYVSIDGIQKELAVPNIASVERMLKDIHFHYGVPTLRSNYFSRKEHSCNRVSLYRKEIAHLLLFPNISDSLKVRLLEQEGTHENLIALATEAGVYKVYPYDLQAIPL